MKTGMMIMAAMAMAVATLIAMKEHHWAEAAAFSGFGSGYVGLAFLYGGM